SHVTSSHDHTSVHLRPPPTHHRLFPRDPAGSEEPLGGLGSADDPLGRSGTMETERAPLLPPGGRQEDGERSADSEPPFPGCSLVEVLGPPPPYSPRPGPRRRRRWRRRRRGDHFAVCANSSVSLAGKQRHHVVRCGICSEATVGPWPHQKLLGSTLTPSSIGKQYPMRMSLLWFIMFLVTVASLAGIMAGTWRAAYYSPRIYFSWSVVLVLVLYSLTRTISWSRARISRPL
ncbi:hypothetical protein CRUP_006388, partial [Coryphaenoides rupestris]